MTVVAYTRVLRGACYLALGALGLMTWSLIDPSPIPVVVAMSVGQVLGTLSLVALIWVMVADVRRMQSASETPGKPRGGP